MGGAGRNSQPPPAPLFPSSPLPLPSSFPLPSPILSVSSLSYSFFPSLPTLLGGRGRPHTRDLLQRRGQGTKGQNGHRACSISSLAPAWDSTGGDPGSAIGAFAAVHSSRHGSCPGPALLPRPFRSSLEDNGGKKEKREKGAGGGREKGREGGREGGREPEGAGGRERGRTRGRQSERGERVRERERKRKRKESGERR